MTGWFPFAALVTLVPLGFSSEVILIAYSGPSRRLKELGTKGLFLSSQADTGPTTRAMPIVVALAFLYTAQGIPFGFATEYLPVVLREQGYSYAGIAALSWLQLPWQLKILWAKAADSPRLRPHARGLILALQMALTLCVAGFAIQPLARAAMMWFALTAIAAALAATQDVFVDAFAVRALKPSQRGYGNTAQVAGYRLGMLIGGAALLLLVERLGERVTLLGCAALVAIASVGAFAGSADPGAGAVADANANANADARAARPSSVRGLVRHMMNPKARDVIVLALTFKLGLHMAGSLLKPMAKDFGWTKERIGWAVVTVGSAGALMGAALGGVLHRRLGERRALVIALVVQTLVCLPLIAVERLHAPLGLTTFAIWLEHFGSGFGTTILFAALMSATRPADAGLHYTILTSANALAIGLGGLMGGILADRGGLLAAFVAATVVSAAPVVLLRKWNASAKASADDTLPVT
jgi:PAT family beta-lactamase induction signal transducer AmpG